MNSILTVGSLLYLWAIMFEASIISFVRKRVNLWPMTAKTIIFLSQPSAQIVFPLLDPLIVLLNQMFKLLNSLKLPALFCTPSCPSPRGNQQSLEYVPFLCKTVNAKISSKNFWLLCSAGGLSCFLSFPKTSSKQLMLINYSLKDKTSNYALQKRTFIIVQRKKGIGIKFLLEFHIFKKTIS